MATERGRVRFIRKGGRVIPIRDKEGERRKRQRTVGRALTGAAIAGGAVTGGATSAMIGANVIRSQQGKKPRMPTLKFAKRISRIGTAASFAGLGGYILRKKSKGEKPTAGGGVGGYLTPMVGGAVAGGLVGLGVNRKLKRLKTVQKAGSKIFKKKRKKDSRIVRGMKGIRSAFRTRVEMGRKIREEFDYDS